MATKTNRSTKTISTPPPPTTIAFLWRIHSSYNGNPLGCYEGLTEQQAVANFINSLDPAIWSPAVDDVYAEPLQTSFE